METDNEPAAPVSAPLDRHPSPHQPQQSSQSGFLRLSGPYDTRPGRRVKPPDLQPGQWVTLLWPTDPEDLDSRDLLRVEALNGTGNVHKQFLLDAAYVLSGNRPGTLHKLDGQTMQEVTQATVALTPGWYQYLVSDSTDGNDPKQWAVIPGFAHWQFPIADFRRAIGQPAPSRLSHWQLTEVTVVQSTSAASIRSDMSGAVKRRDQQRCIVSATHSPCTCENAHLVPTVAAKWYLKNQVWKDNILFDNSPSEKAVNDRCNGITLRGDIHTLLDAGRWVPFPTGHMDIFVAYFFAMEEEEWCELSHAGPIKVHSEVSRRALFARFAWNVFIRAGFRAPQQKDFEAADRARRQYGVIAGASEEGPEGGAPPPSGNTSSRESNKRTRVGSDNSRLTAQSPLVNQMHDQPALDWTFGESSIEMSMLDSVDALKREYRASHPEIKAIGDPAGIASHEQHWRNLLDADELEHYDT